MEDIEEVGTGKYQIGNTGQEAMEKEIYNKTFSLNRKQLYTKLTMGIRFNKF